MSGAPEIHAATSLSNWFRTSHRLPSLSFLLRRRNQQSRQRGLCLHFGFHCCCCFGRPPRLQGPSYIFCLGAISDKVVRTLTDKAALLLLFINLDGPGHPYCESPFSVICLTEKFRRSEWSSEARSALDADSSKAPTPSQLE